MYAATGFVQPEVRCETVRWVTEPSAGSRQPSAVSRQPSAVSRQLPSTNRSTWATNSVRVSSASASASARRDEPRDDGPIGVAKPPRNQLVARNHIPAPMSSSSRDFCRAAIGKSKRTFVPGAGSAAAVRQPLRRRNESSSPLLSRSSRSNWIASFAHSWNSAQVSPIAFRFSGRQMPNQ